MTAFPSTANFILTPKCNANCYFCLNDWREEPYDPSEEMNLGEKLATLDKLAASGVDFLVITGGEPTLDPHLEEVLKHAKSLGIDLFMQTHGMFLSKVKCTMLAQYLLGVQVSIEGLEESHNLVTRGGNWKKSMTGLKNAVESGMIVQVNTTCTKFNKNDMKDFIPLLKSVGVTRLNLIRLYNAGNAMKYRDKLFLEKEEMKKMIHDAAVAAKESHLALDIQGSPVNELLGESQTEHSNCGASVDEITVLYNGNLAPCPSWNKSIGTIKENLDEVWNNVHMKKLRTLHANCNSCPLSLTKSGDEYVAKEKHFLDVREIVGGKKIFSKLVC